MRARAGGWVVHGPGPGKQGSRGQPHAAEALPLFLVVGLGAAGSGRGVCQTKHTAGGRGIGCLSCTQQVGGDVSNTQQECKRGRGRGRLDSASVGRDAGAMRVRCAPPRARAQLQWGPPASEGGNGSCNTTGCRLENPQRSGKYVAAPKIWGSEGVQR